MGKIYSPAVTSSPQGAAQAPPADKVWCIRNDCYKFIKVCDSCRVRTKCTNYRDYWAPRFDFEA